MRQRIEACLQTMVEYNIWFPDEGSFDLEIWKWVKEKVERPLTLTRHTFVGKVMPLLSFSSKEQASFSFFAAVTISVIREPPQKRLSLFTLLSHLFAMPLDESESGE